MCLNKTTFALKYNKRRKEYIGVGYKVFEKGELANYNRIGQWSSATGYFSQVDDSKTLTRLIIDDNYHSDKTSAERLYHPGFHIFLNAEDAKKYNKYGTVYKVEYTGVVAFGTNLTNYSDSGDCVIALRMKILPLKSIKPKKKS